METKLLFCPFNKSYFFQILKTANMQVLINVANMQVLINAACTDFLRCSEDRISSNN